jgi:hypothetical protein
MPSSWVPRVFIRPKLPRPLGGGEGGGEGIPLFWGASALRGMTAAALALVLLTSCSPEASRTRGSGPGADVGNRDYPLPEIHAGAEPAYRTPGVGLAVRK